MNNRSTRYHSDFYFKHPMPELNQENVDRFITEYFDAENKVFYFTAELDALFIHLDDIIVLGDISLRSSKHNGYRDEEFIVYIDMFMKGGGVHRVIMHKGIPLDISANDYEIYEALKQCWLSCLKIKHKNDHLRTV